MDIEEISRRLLALDNAITDSYGAVPYISTKLTIDGDGMARVPMWAGGTSDIISNKGVDSIEGALAAAEAFASTLPSREKHQMREFLEKLSSTIEAGNKIGIPVDFLNPLRQMMDKLSENALEHHQERD